MPEAVSFKKHTEMKEQTSRGRYEISIRVTNK